jgi:hypothetical protein
MPIRCLIGPARSEDFEAQQRLVAPVRLDVVIKRAEAHRGLSFGTPPGAHLSRS